MPKRTKGKATQPPPTKRPSTRSTAATSRLNYSNGATSETSKPAIETSTMPTDMSETIPTTIMVATQNQPLQTQELVSQLSNVIQLLTTSLSGSASISSTQPQGPLPNEDSAEVLSKVSDDPPNTVSPCTSTTANLHTAWHHRTTIRDAPNMLKNLPIIPSRTSQNLSLLFFKIPPIISKAVDIEPKVGSINIGGGY